MKSKSTGRCKEVHSTKSFVMDRVKTNDSSWSEGAWKRKWSEPEGETWDFVRKERSEGVIGVKVNGKVTPVFQESTWNEDEEAGTCLIFDLERNRLCAPSGRLTTDELSTYAERSGPRRVHCEGRLGVRRFDRFCPPRQDEPDQDRQGNWKQAGQHCIKGKGQKVCAMTEKPWKKPRKRHWKT